MAIIGAIITGERDPQKLAQLRDYRTSRREDHSEVIATGGPPDSPRIESSIFKSSSQAVEGQMLADSTYQEKIAECDRQQRSSSEHIRGSQR